MLGKRIFLLALFFVVGIIAYGQKKKAAQSTSVQPGFPQKDYAPKAKKKSKKSVTTYDARNNFYDRQEIQKKQQLKNESNLDNPQYTDQQYFGHKRPPRKRSPDKMKFCKVCGIRH